jgi:3-hydroxyacyl-CoA dehydrogenase / enoyl-CoA hydratase / 3-hydroxybutyryl-CoA epimerase / enoyl-CoA isomerase
MSSHYRQIDGVKYSASLLDAADELIAGQGDGRIGLSDAEKLLKMLGNDGKYSDLEKKSLSYIRQNYTFTEQGDNFLRTQIRSWAAIRGHKNSNNNNSLFDGKTIQCRLEGDYIELIFNHSESSVNKFDRLTLEELRSAVDAIKATSDIKGMLVKSDKSGFIFGADIKEFGAAFKQSEEDLISWLGECNSVFNDIEDLPFPTVTAINGVALGGGCEMALSTDFRVIDTKGNIGLPEIKLGIYPGFGGTIRLPRIIGLDNAIEIIAAGKSVKAPEALKMKIVDAVVETEKLQDAAYSILEQAASEKLNWQQRRDIKKDKLRLAPIEQMLAFQVSMGFTKASSKGYLAPVEAIKTMQKTAGMRRNDAQLVEAKGFIKLAKSTVSQALVGIFLSDDLIKKKGKQYGKIAKKVDRAAVLGAGIMGGGIAYQSAYKNIPITMKDIRQEGINQGMTEATKLLSKLAKRGRIDNARMAEILANINPTLSYGKEDFSTVNIVVEAVVENPKIKHIVLSEIEKTCSEGTIITSNTSSISIDYLAECLERPENFCGMHFFNPVHRMPLVEIIRGKHTSEEAIATTVAYASRMGKTPIVVNDCPGFLVNRVLFPYFSGFQFLLIDGADFKVVDKTMERFGWPMGPAYLLDVVGMDTAYHVADVLAKGYPDRMASEGRNALHVMYDTKRFGQKNGQGFYSYTMDKRGKPRKNVDESVNKLIAQIQTNGQQEFSNDEIIERMMIPMIIETARCLEEGIVDTASEADMGLIMGIGFPPFHGGALRYADTFGLKTICEMADKYAHLGKLYQPTEKMREMAASGATYYQQ